MGGATMQKDGDFPYWNKSQYKLLTEGTWDIVVIMLGTNDADDRPFGPRFHNNWHNGRNEGCEKEDLSNCVFAADYRSFIDIVKKLGTTPTGPKVYIAVPPPVMKQGVYGTPGMN